MLIHRSCYLDLSKYISKNIQENFKFTLWLLFVKKKKKSIENKTKY